MAAARGDGPMEAILKVATLRGNPVGASRGKARADAVSASFDQLQAVRKPCSRRLVSAVRVDFHETGSGSAIVPFAAQVHNFIADCANLD
jgi:hypothetical protein